MDKTVQKRFFSPTFGNKPRYLLGRDDVISRLCEGLQTPPGSRERARLIIGQRGYGKTVALLELAEQARKAGYIVASPTIVSPALLDSVMEKLQKDSERFLKTGKKSVSGGSIGAFGFSAGLQFDRQDTESKTFAFRIDRFCEEMNRRRKSVLILIDEVQGGSEELKQLIIAYQELVGEGRDVAIVMAGLPAALSVVLNDKVLTFLNRAEKIMLEPLRIAEVEAFFRRAFREESIAVPDHLLQKAAEKTEGSPYMMQLIGYYLTLNATSDAKITDKVFKKAIAGAEKDFQNDICLTVLRSLSDRDVRFLREMSSMDEPALVADIAKGMGVSREYAQQYRRRLLDAGLIETVKRGEVRFAVPYLADYLRNTDAV